MERGAKRNSEPGYRQKHPPHLLSLLLSLEKGPDPPVAVCYGTAGLQVPWTELPTDLQGAECPGLLVKATQTAGQQVQLGQLARQVCWA